MSAICGIIRFDGTNVNKEDINEILNHVHYEVYNKANVWVNKSIGFGCKLLYTTPEAPYDKQPFFTQDDSLFIVADARIDNRDELIEEFICENSNKSYVADSELILHAYKKWGTECTSHLIGDFTFVIWDSKEEQIYCVRDHLGIRPFYYYVDSNYLIFSSDIGAIFSQNDIEKKPNMNAMKSFAYHVGIEYDQTFYKDIKRLPAANHMIVKKKNITIHRYWKIEEIKQNQTITFQEAVIRFQMLFKKSIQDKLRAINTVGCELSGGLDSSSVLSVCHQGESTNHINAFSMRYGEYNCDEGEYIESVAKKLDISPIYFQADEIDYVHEYDMEFNYQVNQYWPIFTTFTQSFPFAKKIKEKGVQVILTGQGGDHLLGGNLYYMADYVRTLQVKKLFKEIKKYKFSKKVMLGYTILPLLNNKQKKIIKSFIYFFRKKHQIISTNHTIPAEPFSIGANSSKLSISFKKDLEFITGTVTALNMDNTSNIIIEKEYGIEYRHPFFDRRIVELMLSLPPEFKLKDGYIKRILREAMKNILPEKVRLRTDKALFSEVIMSQMQAIDLQKLMNKSNIVSLGIVKQNQVDELLCEYELTQEPSAFLWGLINLEIWYYKNFQS